MTNYSATIDNPGRGGEVGVQNWASGYYTLAGAITGHSSTGDTITFSNILPEGGAIVRDVVVAYPELDTNGTPSGTMIVGNTDSDDGYIITQNVGLAAQVPANGQQMIARGTVGDLLNTRVTNRDIIIEFTAALATSATAGTIRLSALLEGSAA